MVETNILLRLTKMFSTNATSGVVCGAAAAATLATLLPTKPPDIEYQRKRVPRLSVLLMHQRPA